MDRVRQRPLPSQLMHRNGRRYARTRRGSGPPVAEASRLPTAMGAPRSSSASDPMTLRRTHSWAPPCPAKALSCACAAPRTLAHGRPQSKASWVQPSATAVGDSFPRLPLHASCLPRGAGHSRFALRLPVRASSRLGRFAQAWPTTVTRPTPPTHSCRPCALFTAATVRTRCALTVAVPAHAHAHPRPTGVRLCRDRSDRGGCGSVDGHTL